MQTPICVVFVQVAQLSSRSTSKQRDAYDSLGIKARINITYSMEQCPS